ncbi:MAG: ABC transporter ATP-binding protein [Phycisphaerae bacterium]|nr:ABC transporter ATP-binding protein [Phycisphaerae bacterium]NIU11650.1 ABC transporter ATP-binding protein [Phycisphaerae bacterium]
MQTQQILGIVGRNGVGKTTFVKTIVGLLRVMDGSIFIRGQEVTALDAHLISRMGIGYVPQGRGIFPRMTVYEHLLLGSYLIPQKQHRMRMFELIYDVFPILKARANQLAGSLSGGEQEMLAIGRAIAGRPSILILDEPSEGVQPNIVSQFGDIILQLKESMGLSVILIDQNADLIANCVDNAYAIDNGEVVSFLSKEEIQNEAKLSEVLSI